MRNTTIPSPSYRNPPAGDDLYITEIDVRGAGNVLLNADHGPGGVGSTVTANVSADQVLSPGESFTTDFEIGLATTAPFQFFVNVLGIVDAPAIFTDGP